MLFVLEKKAQLKIQQMVFMILAITLFFVLVLIFYFATKVNDMKQDVIDLDREKASRLATKIASNPEFTFRGKSNAIDSDKLMILKEQKAYKNYWENINGFLIKKLAPETKNAECTLQNYPDCDEIKIFNVGKGVTSSSYVALCRIENVNGIGYDKCELAILSIYIENETE